VVILASPTHPLDCCSPLQLSVPQPAVEHLSVEGRKRGQVSRLEPFLDEIQTTGPDTFSFFERHFVNTYAFFLSS
jgi:hypothetical protein